MVWPQRLDFFEDFALSFLARNRNGHGRCKQCACTDDDVLSELSYTDPLVGWCARDIGSNSIPSDPEIWSSENLVLICRILFWSRNIWMTLT
jgi:hypothetical protein